MRSARCDCGRPRREGFITGFIRKDATTAEQRWKKYEDAAPTVFGTLDDRTIFDSPELVDALKDLFALHFTRSRTMTIAYLRSFGGIFDGQLQKPEAIVNDPAMLDRLFEMITGLKPAGPEARLFAFEAYQYELIERLGPGSASFAERIEENFTKMREMLHDWKIEVGVAVDSQFVIGDDPVQTVDSVTGKVGILSGVPIGQADGLIMPFGPQHTVAAAKANGFVDIPAAGVDRINRIQVISAEEKVFARPGSNLSGAIARHHATRRDLAGEHGRIIDSSLEGSGRRGCTLVV